MQTLTINGKDYQVDVPDEMPLLWAIRDFVGLTGTKFGCGVAQCGACSIMIDGTVVRSCSTQVSQAIGRQITTIEGESPNLEYLRQAWEEISVPQCGYCQSGQLISATALLDTNEAPTDEDIDNAMSGNICRCGTYVRIRKAIHKAVELRNGTVELSKIES
jgi:isoquinoline 1-oxidoreductase alpha subunit